jgi:hypothetical protein
MTRSLDVLVLENRAGAADERVRALELAGHRVHRCHDAGDRGFPCRGVSHPGSCPLDRRIDVAVVVRRRVTPRPTALEAGVQCALRAQVPLVEDGPEALDPFGPWIAGRVGEDDDLVAACALAVDRSFDPLRDQVRAKVAPLLQNAGIDPGSVACDVERTGPALSVRLDVPVAVSTAVEQALGVRVLDAIRSSPHTFGQVHVQVRPPM